MIIECFSEDHLHDYVNFYLKDNPTVIDYMIRELFLIIFYKRKYSIGDIVEILRKFPTNKILLDFSMTSPDIEVAGRYIFARSKAVFSARDFTLKASSIPKNWVLPVGCGSSKFIIGYILYNHPRLGYVIELITANFVIAVRSEM